MGLGIFAPIRYRGGQKIQEAHVDRASWITTTIGVNSWARRAEGVLEGKRKDSKTVTGKQREICSIGIKSAD